MSGQPPVMPPTLSYKSKAQREQEERERREREGAERREREEAERREREEAERRERERLETERAAAARAVEAERRRALTRPSSPPEVTTPRPSVQDARSLVMFEEDGLAPTPREIEDIEMLGPVEEEVPEEEAPEEVVEAAPMRRPPRPPKSPDMRPVYVGFILVFTGLVQFIFGVLAMLGSPDAATGPWSLGVKWGAFSMGLTAALLGVLAIRGGLWSFRKERFSVVKIGAIAATVCVWAWWVPWLFGLAALLVATRARDEYYPFYDPRWDAPEWARPPPTADETTEDEDGVSEELEEGDELVERRRKDTSARDFLDDVSPPDDKEASGLQDADVSTGDGWDDLD